VDGVSRITDFGVARAEARISSTRGSQVKGKVPYMSPEQLRAEELDRQSDVYAVGVVLWELLTGQRLFKAPSDGALVAAVMAGPRATPAQVDPQVPAAIDAVCMHALRERSARFRTSAEFADALEAAAEQAGIHPASARAVGRFVEETLRRHGLLIVPEEVGGAGTVPTDFKSAPFHAPPRSATPLAHPEPLLPRERFEDDQAPTVARDVSSGVSSLIHSPIPTGTGASAVGPVATSTATPRRSSMAIGIGAVVGGSFLLLMVASVLVWALLLRGPRDGADKSAAGPILEQSPAPIAVSATAVQPASPPPEASAAEPAPSAAPEASATAETPPKPAPAAAKPGKAPVRGSSKTPKPAATTTAKPKSGGEFEPDRL
jgi:serine/threonine-protein kinase